MQYIPRLLGSVAIFVALIGAGCAETSTNNQTAQPVPFQPSVEAVVTDPATPQIMEVTVTGSNFKFEPAAFAFKKGQKVKLTFKNGEGFHDFRIDELSVATKKIKAGEEDTIEFTPDKAGTFEAYCSVGTHRAMGMKASVKVDE